MLEFNKGRLFIKNVCKCVSSMNSWDIDSIGLRSVWTNYFNCFQLVLGSGTTLLDTAGSDRKMGLIHSLNRIGTDREWNRKCEIPEMMSFGNDFFSGPITAKGVSVAIRSYPKSYENREVHSVSVQLSEGLGWAFHLGEGVAKAWLCVRLCPNARPYIAHKNSRNLENTQPQCKSS